MIDYVVYDTATGEILQTGICPESSFYLKGTQDGQAALIGKASDLHDYIKDGQITPKGAQPTPAHIFNYATGQWDLDLSLAKSQKWAEIKAARDAQEFGTLNWGGYTFQCDEVSQRRIQGAVQLAVMDTGFSIEWTLADNSAITLTAQHMVEVGQALADHVNQGHVRARQLRAQIDAAQTQNEIDAITW